MDFIISGSHRIVQDVKVRGKTKSGNHRFLRRSVSIDLKRKRTKVVMRKQGNLLAVRANAQDFRLTLKKKYAPFIDQGEDSIHVMNDNLSKIISESARVLGETEPRKETGRLTQETKDFIMKRKNFKVSCSRGQGELVERKKMFIRRK